MLKTSPIHETDLPLPERRRGKVRDIYRLPARPAGAGAARTGPRVLIVATDRISVFDVVLPTAVPGKGRLLTDISARWFDFIRQRSIIGDHLRSTDPSDLPDLSDEQRAMLEGRIMIGRAAEVIPIEFVVRGYLAGSGWGEYERSQSVCGIALPAGLERCGALPEPIFTPATKATVGHDENIDFDAACAIAGEAVMKRLRDISVRIYSEAAEHARSRGIILADTKFEFGYAIDDEGRRSDEIILIDEVLTPDSSRFWPADEYEPGREQHSFDKQYVRNHLLELVEAGKWDKNPPGPPLPDDVVENTVRRYTEARDRLFGEAR
ncbi:MAG: phosphoribosylaminoimidazolesuccinocarboxamide synthase [Planctomycetota bacterium]|nr:phosphoribosylaminoimidazolesuccinocarboxamide synthase [Planctomycetota bacterium]